MQRLTEVAVCKHQGHLIHQRDGKHIGNKNKLSLIDHQGSIYSSPGG